MALRKQSFVINEYYHLYNRGVEKRLVFLDNSDFNHFRYLMYVCNTEKSIIIRDLNTNFDRGNTIVSIGAYVLMPNHFHVLIKEQYEGGITKFMRKLLTSYSMYFNKKYNRTGKLWQGVFQSTHLNNDNYLKYIYSYIHLNPAKLIDKNWKENINKNTVKLFDYCFNYEYSSIFEYKNNKEHILNKSAFPLYFKNILEHKKEMIDWLSNNLNT